MSEFIAMCKIDKELSMNEIVNMIFEATLWDRDNVFSRNRSANNVYRRGFIYYILLSNGFTSVKIGREYNYDHTSILHYRKMFENELAARPENTRLLQFVIDYVNEFA